MIRRPLLIPGAVLSILGLIGCAGEDTAAVQRAAALASQADVLAAQLDTLGSGHTGVVVQLAFGDEADLDLYVTDPLQETVYFARHESRTGGRILADVRCDTAGPRVEEVHFDQPWPGHYRVGIDHPARCDGARAPAPAAYALIVHADGQTYHAQGTVALEQFEVIVLEFEVQGNATDELLPENS